VQRINIEEKGYKLKDYIDNIVQASLNIFEELTTWNEEEQEEFKVLLKNFRKEYDKNSETTKSKGDRLEELVSFIINKSYFYEIYTNVKTGTNEIDEVIVLSKKGKQAMESFNISKELLPINESVILGECKYYGSSLGVTYVGKFYSLMNACDVNFGIIFTHKGITGKQDEFKHAHGLIKTIRILEKYKNKKDFYIIEFSNEDFILLENGENFFNIIKAKKLALQLSTNQKNFLQSADFNKEDNSVKKLKEICKNQKQ